MIDELAGEMSRKLSKYTETDLHEEDRDFLHEMIKDLKEDLLTTYATKNEVEVIGPNV